MQTRKPWLIPLIVLCMAFAIPFVLVQDIFPLFRFGMFAEAFRRVEQTEQWVVRYQLPENDSARWQILEAEDVYISVATYQQLIRNYHYRGEGEQLLSYIHDICQKKGTTAHTWQLLRISSLHDTTCVAQWQPSPIGF